MALPFGGNDFLEYWSAYQLLQRGENPYDPALLFPIQQALGWPGETPLMMWNPPWTLVLLSPVLQFPYVTAVKLFVACNVLFTIFTGYFSWRIVSEKIRILPLLAASFLFYPVWNTLGLGQIALLLAAALAIAFWALQTGRDLLAGGMLALLSLKPHLVYLVAIVLVWQLVAHRRFRPILGCVSTLLLLVILTALVEPAATSYWLASNHVITSSPNSAVTLASWRTATLGSALSPLAHPIGLSIGQLSTLIGGITGVLALLYCIQRRPRIDWVIALPPLLALSLFTAPFGWLFDQALLVVAQVIIISRVFDSTQRRTREIVISLALLQVLTLSLLAAGFRYHHQFFWFSFVFLLIALRANAIIKTKISADLK